jgi:hypothetical protein
MGSVLKQGFEFASLHGWDPAFAGHTSLVGQFEHGSTSAASVPQSHDFGKY